MKSIPLPSFNVAQAIDRCLDGMRVPDRVGALTGARHLLEAAEANYLSLAPQARLFTISTGGDITLNLTKKMMGEIYKRHFTRQGSASRELYDRIRLSVRNSQCPLCGQRSVSSIDHYLPQSEFPVFNLTPANLVPACSDCNKAKLAKVASTEEQQTLHPYFDRLGSSRWLVVKIIEVSPPGVVFTIQKPVEWTDTLMTRVSRHFQTMGLSALYSAQAAGEIADIAASLVKVGSGSGAAGVWDFLNEAFQTRNSNDPNSWKTALYAGLRDSQWFCTEGYQRIKPVSAADSSWAIL